MRRASELYPGEAKADRRDSFVIADTARIHQARLHWLTAGDELLDELRILGGYDDDLAHDRTRTANRLRDMLLQAAPALERVLGPKLEHRTSRCAGTSRALPNALGNARRRPGVSTWRPTRALVYTTASIDHLHTAEPDVVADNHALSRVTPVTHAQVNSLGR